MIKNFQNLDIVGLTDDEINAFTKFNSDKYIRNYKLLLDNKRPKFNWPAFLFTFQWLGYRKMYKKMLFWCCLCFLGNLIFDLLLHLVSITTSFSFSVITVSIGVYWGYAAYVEYFLYMKKKIKSDKYISIYKETYIERIAKNNGISWKGMFLGVIFPLILGIFELIIIYTIFPFSK